MAGLIGSDGRAGVYWRGNDGGIYTRNNLGQIQQASQSGAGVLAPGDQKFGGLTYREIPNPSSQSQPAAASPGNAPSAPSNPNGYSGGGSSAPAKPDKSNDIALNQAGLNSVDQQTAAGLAAVDKALAKVIGQYDTEKTSNHQNYQTQSDTNQNNRQSGIQSAYLNATQGRQGLFGTMASLGMLNGSGIDLANRAVQSGANSDLSGVDSNFKTNQTTLDTAINAFDQADKERRDNASTAAEDAKTNINNNAAGNKLKFYSQLASDYADEGDTGNAKKFTDLASSLYPNIASTSIPNTNIAYTGAGYQPGTLGNYTVGQNNSTVATSGKPDSFGIPTLLASPDRKKATA